MKYKIAEYRTKPLWGKAFRKACYLLGLDDSSQWPAIVFFEPLAGQDPEGDTETKIRFKDHPMTGPATLKGSCSFVDDYIWVRAEMDDKQTCITMAHELYHYRAYQKGHLADGGGEDQAESFGNMIWNEINRDANQKKFQQQVRQYESQLTKQTK